MRVIFSQVSRWWLLAVLAVSALGYTFVRTDQFQYWDGLVGNLVATLLGIIAGVPVALHLERRRAANEAAERMNEDVRLKREMLTLLREELLDNSNRLQQRASLIKESVPNDPIKMSIWEALRDSGNLKYISEPALISSIANSYRFLAIIHNREEHLMQCHYGIGGTVTFPDGERAPQKLLSIIFGFHTPALASVQLTLATIERALIE